MLIHVVLCDAEAWVVWQALTSGVLYGGDLANKMPVGRRSFDEACAS